MKLNEWATEDSYLHLINEKDKENILIRRCQEGDRSAFREIVERYRSVLFGTAYTMTHDRFQAEDAVQCALVKAWEHMCSLRENSNLRIWLIRIVANEVKMQWRKERLIEIPLDNTPELYTRCYDEIEEIVIRREEYKVLKKAVYSLPIKQRQVVILRYFADLTIPEIALVTGSRTGTIKSRLSRALTRIKSIIKDELEVISDEETL